MTLMLGSKPCSAKAQRLYKWPYGTQDVQKHVKRDVFVNDFLVVCELFYFPSLLHCFHPFHSD